MSEELAGAFIRSLRRASGYVRLYGHEHLLCEEAVGEAARAATDLIESRPGMLMGIKEDTLFVEGSACGLISLQFNSFLRDMVGAGIETIILTPPVDQAEISQLARLIAGDIDDLPQGRSVRLNATDLVTDGIDASPRAGLRRSYTQSLDALRTFGQAVQEGGTSSLDQTASVVKDLLERSLANPAAALLLTTVKSHHEYTFYHSVNTSILSLGLARLAGSLRRGPGRAGDRSDAPRHRQDRRVACRPPASRPPRQGPMGRDPQAPATGGRGDPRRCRTGRGVGRRGGIRTPCPLRRVRVSAPRLSRRHPPSRPRGHGHPLHFFSRLVAVADTYDAITTRRSYRRAEPPSRALQVLMSEAGTSYDPDFVMAFASMMGIYPPGSFLRLASGEIIMVTTPSEDPDEPPGRGRRPGSGRLGHRSTRTDHLRRSRHHRAGPGFGARDPASPDPRKDPGRHLIRPRIRPHGTLVPTYHPAGEEAQAGEARTGRRLERRRRPHRGRSKPAMR